MTIERREEYAEVVSPDAADVRSVDVSTSGPAGTTAHQTETFTTDPYAARREQPVKFRIASTCSSGFWRGCWASASCWGCLAPTRLRALRSSSTALQSRSSRRSLGLFGEAAL